MTVRRDASTLEHPHGRTRRAVLAGSAKLIGTAAALTATSAFSTALPDAASAQEATPEATPDGEFSLYQQSPWWPWIAAHMDDQEPPEVVGGPITTTATQEDGQAFWVFPGPRELDPTVFGSPNNPIGTEVPPLFLGVPTEFREVSADGTYQTNRPTPFSDQFAAVAGSVCSVAVDATAIDGATTKDEIDFEATFRAPEDQGEYRVTVTEPLPHGWAYPSGGGVVTDVILHGVSGWGTRLMPTEFTYSAFWGPGTGYHNGQPVAEQWSVHMMLTEFVRQDPYDLVFDEHINPDLRHLHLMVLPFTEGAPNPLSTGFMLPNGMEQPFLHVMFPGATMERTVGRSAAKGGR